jgi:methyl-accepting chemotaxis protein
MEAVFTSLDRDLITAEGKEGLQKVRQAVDAWHLAAMRLVNGRPAPAGTATMTTVAWPEELAVTAEREINAYVRFLQGRLHQRTEENIRVAEETQTLIIAANMALFVLATGISLWLWRRISVPLRNANRLAGKLRPAICGKNIWCAETRMKSVKCGIHASNERQSSAIGWRNHDCGGESGRRLRRIYGCHRRIADAAAHITVNMAEVAERAEAIFQEADEVHRQMQEIATRISQMAAHAVKAAAVAQTAEDSSRSGQALIDQVADQMRSINDATEKIGDGGEKLSTGSDEIAKFATIINGIAEQTHLLALNAAIEAARAGDAGRGFAVVAQEVNTLAAESAKSAKDVQAMIDSNRQNLAAVVAYVRTGLVGVKAGMEIAGATAMEFTTISREIARVSDLMREISEAVGELSAGGHRVVASVNRVKEKSGETAGRTQAISAAVQQQAASLQQMAGSGQSLDGLAQQMQDAVRKFAV